jgi:hypothetical protein
MQRKEDIHKYAQQHKTKSKTKKKKRESGVLVLVPNVLSRGSTGGGGLVKQYAGLCLAFE